jgi:hypothetical protein
MSPAIKPNVIDEWLKGELAKQPDCPVLGAIKTSTKSMVLDEGALITKLRGLCVAKPLDDDEPD